MRTQPQAGAAGVAPPPRDPFRPLRGAHKRRGERVIVAALWLCAAVSILTTVAIVVVLVEETIPLFRRVSIVDFLTDTRWTPFVDPDSELFHIGILPLVNGTLVVTGIALLVAMPLGLGTAMYLSEYARPRVRRTLKPTLEVLAGIPTVVLGWFALTLVTPLLQSIFGASRVPAFNSASAGIVVGIMIVPTIASLSEDAMSAVPRALREGAYALGATRRHVATKVVVPAALSGITAAVILGMGRAIGETMIVAIAGSGLPRMALDPFQGGQTMTAYIVQAVGGESPRGSITYQTIFGVGLVLFMMTLALNLVAQRVVRRFREVYT
ncbi:MAG TPA: phosphate ABC transporter permease subunit PstC [Nitriliruptorales bacterium]|nr:phosphate ABC transporter permease subunit PstC [Nitriliruptorales bacterium]